MAALTPIEPKPFSFVGPVMAGVGGFMGLLVGIANDAGLIGLIVGAALLAGVAFVFTQMWRQEKPAKWILIAGFGLGGFLMGGVSAAIMGLLFGWFVGWFLFWIAEGRYRAKLVPYLTAGQVLWHYAFRVICGAIFIFLITPIIVVMPLSFNAEDFFTFTPEMLRLDPEGPLDHGAAGAGPRELLRPWPVGLPAAAARCSNPLLAPRGQDKRRLGPAGAGPGSCGNGSRRSGPGRKPQGTCGRRRRTSRAC